MNWPEKNIPQVVGVANRPGGQESDLEPLTLSEILGIYLRWWKLSLYTFFGILIPAVVVIFLILPLYEAKGELWVHRDSPQSNFSIQNGPAGSTTFRNVDREEEISTRAEMLKARTIAEQVVSELDLSMDKLNYIHDARRYVQMVMYGVIDGAKWCYEGLKSILHLGRPLTEAEKMEFAHIRLVDEVIDRIDVAPKMDSNILQVAFRSSDPVVARDVVNLLMDRFINFQGQMREDRAFSFFSETTRELHGELEAAEKELLNLQMKSTGFGVDKQNDSLVNSYETAKEKLRLLSVEEAKIKAQIKSVEEQLKGVPESVLTQEQGVGKVKQGIVWELNPVHQQLSLHLLNLRTAQQALAEEQRGTRELLGEYSQELDTVGAVRLAMREQERRIRVLEDAYDLNVRNLEEARISKAMAQASFSSVRVVSYAPLPLKTVRPRKLFYLLIALVASVLVALALPFLAYLNDSTISSEADVRKYLNIDFVSSFPRYDQKTLGNS